MTQKKQTCWNCQHLTKNENNDLYRCVNFRDADMKYAISFDNIAKEDAKSGTDNCTNWKEVEEDTSSFLGAGTAETETVDATNAVAETETPPQTKQEQAEQD